MPYDYARRYRQPKPVLWMLIGACFGGAAIAALCLLIEPADPYIQPLGCVGYDRNPPPEFFKDPFVVVNSDDQMRRPFLFCWRAES